MYSTELQEKIKRIEINIEKTKQIYEQRKKQEAILTKEESIWMEMLKLKNDECSSEKLRLHKEQDNLWKGRSKFLNNITLSLEKISPQKQILKLTRLNDSILNKNAIGVNISNTDSINNNNDFKCEQIKEKIKNLQVKIKAANMRIKELQSNEYNTDNAIKADDCYQTIHSTILQILEKIDKNEDNIKDITSNILNQKYVHFQKECASTTTNIFSNEISSTQVDSTLNNLNVYHTDADEVKFPVINRSQLSYDGLPLNDTLTFNAIDIKKTDNNESVSIKIENSSNENSFTIIDDKMCDKMFDNIKENETIIAAEYERQLNTLFQDSNNSGFVTAAEIVAISSEPSTKKKFVFKKQTNH